MPKGLQIVAENKNGIARISIVGRIANWWNSAEDFRYNVTKMKENGVTDVELYINSEGGDVFEANEIVNIIKSFGGTVIGKGGALVASAATYIATACDTFEMAKNGQFMIHKPVGSFKGNEDEIESKLKLLQNLTVDYVKTYANQTGMSEDEIKDLLKSDNWMTAQEAKEKGFIDAVEGDAVIDAETAQTIMACGSPIQVEISKQIKETMKIDATIIGLPTDATDAQIEAKMKELQLAANKVAQLEIDAKAKAEQERIGKINALVDDAIAAKKITAAQSETYRKLATADFDAAKDAIDAMVGITALSKQIKPNNFASVESARKDWDYETWAEKDPHGLMAMRESNEEQFTALFESHYGK